VKRLRTADEVVARLVPHRWAWAEANAGAIASHWERRVAARPSMFDGRVLMLARLGQERGRISADFFETSYSRLTAWLDFDRPGDPVLNGFAMGALRGSDGGFILGRMAAHTANAGQLYFPAGTPDLSDVDAAGDVDLAGSLLREITEETGLGPEDWTVEPRWIVVAEEGRVAFMRVVTLAAPAEAACVRIRQFLAQEARAELADVQIVSSRADLDPRRMPGYLTAFLGAAWSGQIE
jgi:8-oxo-dGTP pyrophosphatase MutT (NUDIX family)